jgi:hypothetical protein
LRPSIDIVLNSESRRYASYLSIMDVNVTVLSMYTIGRLLQLWGLTIPPISIIAQLNQHISLGQMLGFLAVSIGVFSVGYLLQRYSGGQP